MQSRIQSKVTDVLSPTGFEVHPFKIGWYNDQIQEVYKLSYPEDTLAFIIISIPEMFEKAFIPFLKQEGVNGVQDPVDECMIHHLGLVRKEFPDEDISILHDFELHPSRRPKILVQTAGHVAGAAYYYQKSDLPQVDWGERSIYGVSIHPKYGGWFAFRGVIIFTNVLCPEMTRKLPQNVVDTPELLQDLLERYNGNWKDWSYRDIIPVQCKYSEEQKEYFATAPKDRKKMIMEILARPDHNKLL